MFIAVKTKNLAMEEVAVLFDSVLMIFSLCGFRMENPTRKILLKL